MAVISALLQMGQGLRMVYSEEDFATSSDF
jgi:hypothetical protein